MTIQMMKLYITCKNAKVCCRLATRCQIIKPGMQFALTFIPSQDFSSESRFCSSSLSFDCKATSSELISEDFWTNESRSSWLPDFASKAWTRFCFSSLISERKKCNNPIEIRSEAVWNDQEKSQLPVVFIPCRSKII